MRGLRSWAVAAALALASCGPAPVERDPAPHTQTSELSYGIQRLDFGYATRIPYTFTNQSPDTVAFQHCEGDVRPLLQVQRDGRWVDAWHPLMRSCESAPLEVPPGGTLSDTLSVAGGPPGSNVSPNFVFEEVEGVYRLYWFQARRPSGARPADDSWRVSNPFVLAFP